MSLAVATGTVTATASIKELIESTWTAAGQDTTLLFWRNTTNQPRAGATHCRINLDFGSSVAATWGEGATNQQFGLIQLRIYGPSNEGAGGIRAIADAFKAAFTRTRADEVIFQNPFTGDGPRGPFRADSGALAGQGLDVPFYYWEVVS